MGYAPLSLGYQPMTMLKQFHDVFGVERAAKGDVGYPLYLRQRLISEEYNEVTAELNQFYLGKGSKQALAKELADLLYVVYGTAEVLGINLEAVFKAVHENNMSKAPGGVVKRREDGKILKPDGYKPVDLSGIVVED